MRSLAECVAEVNAREEDEYYVYVLLRPSGEPFYVGCGRVKRSSQQRIQDHEMEARKRGAKGHKTNVIRSIWNVSQTVRYSIESWHQSPEAMFAREVELIRSIGRRDLLLGPLTNGNDGGTGQLNPSADIRARIGDTKRLAYQKNPDARAKASERAREIMSRPGVREKLRMAALRQFSEPGAGDAVRMQNLRRFADPAQRLAAAARARKQMESPEARAAFSERINKNREANLQRSVEARRADPTFKDRMSEVKKRQAREKEEFRSRVIAAARDLGIPRTNLPANRAALARWRYVGLQLGVVS